MTLGNYLSLCLFGIFAYLLADTEAIVGGTLLRIGALYTVSLQYPEHHHVCGGNIIRRQFILTAAHCVLDQNGEFLPGQIYIRDRNRNGLEELITLKVQQIYVPKEYNRRSYIGDIAVLKLRQRISDGGLAPPRNGHYLELAGDYLVNITGQRAVIAGFGWTRVWPRGRMSVNGTGDDKHLYFSETHVLTDITCALSYPSGMINRTLHFCVKAVRAHGSRGPVGVCTGDEGGILALKEGFTTRLAIGVLTKRSPKCDERTHPAIYTRISHYHDFIQNALAGRVTENMRTHQLPQ